MAESPDIPDWYEDFKFTWNGDRLTVLSETVPPTVKDYLSLIGPGDWQSTLDQFVRQEDHCIFLDTGVTFSNNWSDEEDEDSEEDDGSYSKNMIFCAGPLKSKFVDSRRFLQILMTALEQREQQGLGPVKGQTDFCKFVEALEDRERGTMEVSVKKRNVDTDGQEPATSKRLKFDDPEPYSIHDTGEGARGTMQDVVEKKDDIRGAERYGHQVCGPTSSADEHRFLEPHAHADPVDLTQTITSICGCGEGYAGCDDSGRCKTCVEKDSSCDSDDSGVEGMLTDEDAGVGGMFTKLFASGGPHWKYIRKTVRNITNRPSKKDTDEERSAKFFSTLGQMKQAVELMQRGNQYKSIPTVYQSLVKSIVLPIYYYNHLKERKEIGNHLATIDAAPVFMEYLAFLTLETPRDTGEILARECLDLLYSILLTLTDASSEFICAVGKSGVLELLVQELAKCNTGESQNQIDIERLIATLDNSARITSSKIHFHDAGAVNVLQPYLCSEDQSIKLMAFSCLSFIVETSELHFIKVSPALADYIVALLKQAISRPKHDAEIGSLKQRAIEIVATVSSLVRNDDNKHIFVERGLLDLLATFIEVGNDNEIESASACIQALATHDGIRTDMKNNSSLVEGLKAQLNHASWSVRNAAKKTVKLLKT